MLPADWENGARKGSIFAARADPAPTAGPTRTWLVASNPVMVSTVLAALIARLNVPIVGSHTPEPLYTTGQASATE